MKKFFILLMVVLMLSGLIFTSFAGRNDNGRNGAGEGDCLQDGSGDACPNPDCPNPDGCEPDGDEHKWGRQEE
jgi:hypothetical protein